MLGGSRPDGSVLDVPARRAPGAARSRPGHAGVGSRTVRGVRGRQLTLVSYGVLPPSVEDLEGLLLGPGQLARMGGTARLSVLVTDDWRRDALCAAFTERGLPAGTGDTGRDAGSATGGDTGSDSVRGSQVVRTPFVAALRGVAARWQRGAVKAVPERFALDGARLRLWALAAGSRDGSGYLLALGAHDDPNVWSSAGSVLAAAGLPGTFLEPSASGPAYRVTGRRRLARLAELVGEPPPGAEPTGWPT